MVNSTVINSISGATNQIPQDTVASQSLNFLSPTWHLRNIGGQLLEAAPGSVILGTGTLLRHELTTLLALLVPSIVFMAAGYTAFLRNETLSLE